MRTRYQIKTKNVTGLRETLEVAVHLDTNEQSCYRNCRSVDSADLGCSRYYAAGDDEEAVRRFLGEHGIALVKMTPIQ